MTLGGVDLGLVLVRPMIVIARLMRMRELAFAILRKLLPVAR